MIASLFDDGNLIGFEGAAEQPYSQRRKETYHWGRDSGNRCYLSKKTIDFRYYDPTLKTEVTKYCEMKISNFDPDVERPSRFFTLDGISVRPGSRVIDAVKKTRYRTPSVQAKQGIIDRLDQLVPVVKSNGFAKRD
jgi:hypothetical protein